MRQEKLEIKIISNSEVVCTYTPRSKNEAKRFIIGCQATHTGIPSWL